MSVVLKATLDAELAVTQEGGHAMTASMKPRLRRWLEEALADGS